eukprot:CAMPEP_0184500048 /NCGR_PEP_ID=MMETSP0113_2-20130426/43445_1 /TAXON_ID=91329 /ORGANISM="Norrisiella sphaerica, Strain BC52" /LENGTH=430 /DNA_ID=CAMNT_0026888239 /DNA_START=43 /DNA_END=1335 /DNA_ORIENTATION=-
MARVQPASNDPRGNSSFYQAALKEAQREAKRRNGSNAEALFEEQRRAVQELGDRKLAMKLAGVPEGQNDANNRPRPQPQPMLLPGTPASPGISLGSPGSPVSQEARVFVPGEDDTEEGAGNASAAVRREDVVNEINPVYVAKIREDCDPSFGIFFYIGYLKTNYTREYLSVTVIINFLDFITDILLCLSLRGVFLAIQIIATMFGVCYLFALAFLVWHQEFATGLMFSRYFMPFMGVRKVEEGTSPVKEEASITTSKRVVLESLQFMQSYSEDGLTLVNALLKGRKFAPHNYFAYGITALFTLDTLIELGTFCCALLYGLSIGGEFSLTDLLISMVFVVLLGCCATLWGYFITLFYQDLEVGGTGQVFLFMALAVVIIGSIVTNIYFWKGRAGLNVCEGSSLFSVWRRENFKSKAFYREAAKYLAGIPDD